MFSERQGYGRLLRPEAEERRKHSRDRYNVKNGTKCWHCGTSIADLACSNSLAVHHILTKGFLSQNDMEIDEANTMANYAFVCEEDNLAMSDRAPADVYVDLNVEQKKRAAQQFIEYGSHDLLTIDNYHAFLEKRARSMAKALNEFLDL